MTIHVWYTSTVIGDLIEDLERESRSIRNIHHIRSRITIYMYPISNIIRDPTKETDPDVRSTSNVFPFLEHVFGNKFLAFVNILSKTSVLMSGHL